MPGAEKDRSQLLDPPSAIRSRSSTHHRSCSTNQTMLLQSLTQDPTGLVFFAHLPQMALVFAYNSFCPSQNARLFGLSKAPYLHMTFLFVLPQAFASPLAFTSRSSPQFTPSQGELKSCSSDQRSPRWVDGRTGHFG